MADFLKEKKKCYAGLAILIGDEPAPGVLEGTKAFENACARRANFNAPRRYQHRGAASARREPRHILETAARALHDLVNHEFHECVTDTI